MVNVDLFGPLVNQPPTARAGDSTTVECTSPEGASVALTQQQFGDKAAQELQVRLRSTRDADRIIRYQTITCDNLAGVCYDRLGAGYGLTRLYLGESQGDALLERLQASPQT